MATRLVSVNIGSAAPLQCGGRTVATAIFKQPVTGPIAVDRLGLAGDQQADRRHHGGPDKAINVYPNEHLAHWSERLGKSLEPGAFGENFTSLGWVEDQVCIGDIYQIGADVLVQVTQPRQPCGKLAARHAQPQLVRWVVQSGKTGFYLRCLEPGRVAAGDHAVLVQRPRDTVSLVEANRVMHFAKNDTRAVQRLLASPGLSQAWCHTLRTLRKHTDACDH